MNNEGSPLYKQICSLPDEEKRQLLGQLFKADPRMLTDELMRALLQCSDSTREKLREGIGCGCNAQLEAMAGACSGNRRLSIVEENRLRANSGGTVDIPTVQGGGASETVTVPAYGVEYFLREFSMDGAMSSNTGSLSKVHVQISHAGILLAEFRVSQYYKAACCTSIVEQFKRLGVCFGYDSTWDVTVTNKNTNAAEEFINGALSFIRGFPTAFPLVK
jgi:hypothetical protein